jgi:transmembrane sensor
VVVFALAVFWSRYPSGGSKRSFSTVVGGFQRVVLDDQSIVDLNTDSEVRVDFRPRTRIVNLVRGEASFEVAHDDSRPFIVITDSMAVRAVGTKFDVRRFGGSTEVTVAEGSVVVGSSEVMEAPQIAPDVPQVSAGQSATANGNGVNLQTLSKDGIARKLAWRSQMLVFDSDTLAEVVAQFNRYNDRQIAIADPNLTTLKISGYFRPTNLDAFLNVLQSSFGIRIAATGNIVVLATDATT